MKLSARRNKAKNTPASAPAYATAKRKPTAKAQKAKSPSPVRAPIRIATPPPPPPVPQFTITWEIFWKNKIIHSSSQTSGKFKFQQWTESIIRIVEDKASKQGFLMKLIKSQATITSNKEASIASCGGIDDWEVIQDIVAVWASEKRPRITVKIEYSYSPDNTTESDDDNDNSDVVSIDSDNDDNPTPSVATSKKRKNTSIKAARIDKIRRTTTIKQQEKLAEIHESNEPLSIAHKIGKRWTCDGNACANRTRFCYLDPQEEKVPKTHLPILAEDINKWASNIEKCSSGVSIDQPSLAFRDLLWTRYKAKEQSKRKLTANPANPADPANTANPAPAVPAVPATPQVPSQNFTYNITNNGDKDKTPPMPGPGMNPFYHQQPPPTPTPPPPNPLPPQYYPNPYYYPQQMPLQMLQQPPPYYWPQYQGYNYPPQSPAVQPVQPAQPPIAQPHQQPASNTSAMPLPSSPVECSFDPEGDLEAYFRWQITKYPTQELILLEAQNKLADEYFTITDIRMFKEQDWIKRQIPIGLGARLQRDVKSFVRTRERSASSSRPSSSKSQAQEASKAQSQEAQNALNLDLLASIASMAANS